MDDVMDAIEYFSKYWNKRFEEEYQQVQKFRRKCAELTDTLVDAKKTIERLGYENRRLLGLLEELAEEFSIQDYPEPRTGLIVECIDALGLDGWKR